MAIIEKSIGMNVPPSTAYSLWTRFEEIPRSGRWRVLLNGRRVMAAAVKLREVAYTSLDAEVA